MRILDASTANLGNAENNPGDENAPPSAGMKPFHNEVGTNAYMSIRNLFPSQGACLTYR